MNYLTGYTLKPSQISAIGEVLFTDGRDDDLMANQVTCEAYGYTYDQTTGTCRAFSYNTNLERDISNINNTINGPGNSTQLGSNTIQINGTLNTTRGFNNNCFINGENNEIANSVNNTTALGVLGEATASNSIVLGGNTTGDLLGERQFVRCLYGAQTTSNSTISSGINNETGVRFAIPDNSIIYFHADTIVVRTGGSNVAGAVGDYGSYVERGVIINKSGTTTIQRERDTIKTSGTVTNWRILAETGGAAGATLKLACRGQTDMTLEWCMNVNITQIKTGVAL